MGYKNSKVKAQLLRILSHPVRLMIVEELSKGVKCVQDIKELLGRSQPNISQHLAVLRYNRIVGYYSEGLSRCYYLRNPHLVKALFIFLEGRYLEKKRSKASVKCEGRRRAKLERRSNG